MGESESISVVPEGSAAANAYGSIVGDHEATGSGATEDRVYSTAKGIGTCKCHESNLKCHDLCARDKAKCKNKAAVKNATEVARGPRTAAVSDGELHFRQELHDRCSILNKEFVATLDPVKKDNILVHLLSMRRGSLDKDPNDPEPPAEETPEWCKC